jgi:hypothetical protein
VVGSLEYMTIEVVRGGGEDRWCGEAARQWGRRHNRGQAVGGARRAGHRRMGTRSRAGGRRERCWEKDVGRTTPGEGVMHSPHGVPLLHRLVVSVCQSPSNRVEVTGDDNRAGWEGWALDLRRNPSSKASTALLDAGLHLRAPVWWSWGRALIGLSF